MSYGYPPPQPYYPPPQQYAASPPQQDGGMKRAPSITNIKHATNVYEGGTKPRGRGNWRGGGNRGGGYRGRGRGGGQYYSRSRSRSRSNSRGRRNNGNRDVQIAKAATSILLTMKKMEKEEAEGGKAAGAAPGPRDRSRSRSKSRERKREANPVHNPRNPLRFMGKSGDAVHAEILGMAKVLSGNETDAILYIPDAPEDIENVNELKKWAVYWTKGSLQLNVGLCDKEGKCKDVYVFIGEHDATLPKKTKATALRDIAAKIGTKNAIVVDACADYDVKVLNVWRNVFDSVMRLALNIKRQVAKMGRQISVKELVLEAVGEMHDKLSTDPDVYALMTKSLSKVTFVDIPGGAEDVIIPGDDNDDAKSDSGYIDDGVEVQELTGSSDATLLKMDSLQRSLTELSDKLAIAKAYQEKTGEQVTSMRRSSLSGSSLDLTQVKAKVNTGLTAEQKARLGRSTENVRSQIMTDVRIHLELVFRGGSIAQGTTIKARLTIVEAEGAALILAPGHAFRASFEKMDVSGTETWVQKDSHVLEFFHENRLVAVSGPFALNAVREDNGLVIIRLGDKFKTPDTCSRVATALTSGEAFTASFEKNGQGQDLMLQLGPPEDFVHDLAGTQKLAGTPIVLGSDLSVSGVVSDVKVNSGTDDYVVNYTETRIEDDGTLLLSRKSAKAKKISERALIDKFNLQSAASARVTKMFKAGSVSNLATVMLSALLVLSVCFSGASAAFNRGVEKEVAKVLCASLYHPACTDEPLWEQRDLGEMYGRYEEVTRQPLMRRPRRGVNIDPSLVNSSSTVMTSVNGNTTTYQTTVPSLTNQTMSVIVNLTVSTTPQPATNVTTTVSSTSTTTTTQSTTTTTETPTTTPEPDYQEMARRIWRNANADLLASGNCGSELYAAVAPDCAITAADPLCLAQCIQRTPVGKRYDCGIQNVSQWEIPGLPILTDLGGTYTFIFSSEDLHGYDVGDEDALQAGFLDSTDTVKVSEPINVTVPVYFKHPMIHSTYRPLSRDVISKLKGSHEINMTLQRVTIGEVSFWSTGWFSPHKVVRIDHQMISDYRGISYNRHMAFRLCGVEIPGYYFETCKGNCRYDPLQSYHARTGGIPIASLDEDGIGHEIFKAGSPASQPPPPPPADVIPPELRDHVLMAFPVIREVMGRLQLLSERDLVVWTQKSRLYSFKDLDNVRFAVDLRLPDAAVLNVGDLKNKVQADCDAAIKDIAWNAQGDAKIQAAVGKTCAMMGIDEHVLDVLQDSVLHLKQAHHDMIETLKKGMAMWHDTPHVEDSRRRRKRSFDLFGKLGCMIDSVFGGGCDSGGGGKDYGPSITSLQNSVTQLNGRVDAVQSAVNSVQDSVVSLTNHLNDQLHTINTRMAADEKFASDTMARVSSLSKTLVVVAGTSGLLNNYVMIINELKTLFQIVLSSLSTSTAANPTAFSVSNFGMVGKLDSGPSLQNIDLQHCFFRDAFLKTSNGSQDSFDHLVIELKCIRPSSYEVLFYPQSIKVLSTCDKMSQTHRDLLNYALVVSDIRPMNCYGNVTVDEQTLDLGHSHFLGIMGATTCKSARGRLVYKSDIENCLHTSAAAFCFVNQVSAADSLFLSSGMMFPFTPFDGKLVTTGVQSDSEIIYPITLLTETVFLTNVVGNLRLPGAYDGAMPAFKIVYRTCAQGDATFSPTCPQYSGTRVSSVIVPYPDICKGSNKAEVSVTLHATAQFMQARESTRELIETILQNVTGDQMNELKQYYDVIAAVQNISNTEAGAFAVAFANQTVKINNLLSNATAQGVLVGNLIKQSEEEAKNAKTIPQEGLTALQIGLFVGAYVCGVGGLALGGFAFYKSTQAAEGFDLMGATSFMGFESPYKGFDMTMVIVVALIVLVGVFVIYCCCCKKGTTVKLDRSLLEHGTPGFKATPVNGEQQESQDVKEGSSLREPAMLPNISGGVQLAEKALMKAGPMAFLSMSQRKSKLGLLCVAGLTAPDVLLCPTYWGILAFVVTGASPVGLGALMGTVALDSARGMAISSPGTAEQKDPLDQVFGTDAGAVTGIAIYVLFGLLCLFLTSFFALLIVTARRWCCKGENGGMAFFSGLVIFLFLCVLTAYVGIRDVGIVTDFRSTKVANELLILALLPVSFMASVFIWLLTRYSVNAQQLGFGGVASTTTPASDPCVNMVWHTYMDVATTFGLFFMFTTIALAALVYVVISRRRIPAEWRANWWVKVKLYATCLACSKMVPIAIKIRDAQKHKDHMDQESDVISDIYVYIGEVKDPLSVTNVYLPKTAGRLNDKAVVMGGGDLSFKKANLKNQFPLKGHMIGSVEQIIVWMEDDTLKERAAKVMLVDNLDAATKAGLKRHAKNQRDAELHEVVASTQHVGPSGVNNAFKQPGSLVTPNGIIVASPGLEEMMAFKEEAERQGWTGFDFDSYKKMFFNKDARLKPVLVKMGYTLAR